MPDYSRRDCVGRMRMRAPSRFYQAGIVALLILMVATASACGSSREGLQRTPPADAEGTEVPIAATRLPTLTPPPAIPTARTSGPPAATSAATLPPVASI